MRSLSAVLGVVALLGAAAPASGQQVRPSLLKARFSRLPIYFIENQGVYPDEVAFYVHGADKTLFFTKDGILFRLRGEDKGWVVKLAFVGANPDVTPRGEDKQQAVFSYFKGPEKDWKTGLETYAKVVYAELWPGIDLVYEGTANQLKYVFLVKPGADPANIRLRYYGVSSLRRTATGALQVETPGGSFEDAPPAAWQAIDGQDVRVEMTYLLDSKGGSAHAEFGFGLGRYDRSRSLVLDPAVLIYCGYIGGAIRVERARGIALDAAGNAYITGMTDSTEQTFPVTVGPDLTHNGTADAFVAKVNAAGTALVYCGYIGGNASEEGWGVAVDASGNAYVSGWTGSSEQTFPVRAGPGRTHHGWWDAFVAKVNAAGTALVYCGYIGGSGVIECANGIAVDAAGNAYVAGMTYSTEQTFPVTVGPDLTHNGGTDAFVAKVNAAGTAFVYCGYIGGSFFDHANAIGVDAAGNAYVTGLTSSTEQTFPVIVGPDLSFNGGGDAFVAKVNAAGTALFYCGYIGGSSGDGGEGIAVDAAGNAYVSGSTSSTEKQAFPVTVGPDLTHNGSIDAFVAKVNTPGTALVYCGYIGGNGVKENALAVAVDAAGNAYVAGVTDSTEQTFPVTVGPDLTHNGGDDAFVAKVNAAGTALVYCGYIGGAGFTENAEAVAADAAGNAYVAGMTNSTEQTFPVTVGPDLTYNGPNFDVFVARVGHTILSGSGVPRPGGQVNLSLTASADARLSYQVGSSLGTGPIPIGTRSINLSGDDLLVITVSGYWPGFFHGYSGILDGHGQARAAIHIPKITALVGVRLHSAFVTLDPPAPWGIRSISNTFSFPITK